MEQLELSVLDAVSKVRTRHKNAVMKHLHKPNDLGGLRLLEAEISILAAAVEFLFADKFKEHIAEKISKGGVTIIPPEETESEDRIKELLK